MTEVGINFAKINSITSLIHESISIEKGKFHLDKDLHPIIKKRIYQKRYYEAHKDEINEKQKQIKRTYTKRPEYSRANSRYNYYLRLLEKSNLTKGLVEYLKENSDDLDQQIAFKVSVLLVSRIKFTMNLERTLEVAKKIVEQKTLEEYQKLTEKERLEFLKIIKTIDYVRNVNLDVAELESISSIDD
jgi:hypothetical protein